MDRVQQEHAILNAWLDDGINNGIFYEQETINGMIKDLQTVDIAVLDKVYSFWVQNKIPLSELRTKSCTCGAKHTSNPKFHLSYCELDKK